MSLKIALGGKGGVGKTTLSALISRVIAKKNSGKVIAIDADPVTNLAAGLGISDETKITPISELSDLIEERTGAKAGTMGGFFTINPKVDDIPERFSYEKDGVKLLVMGTVQKGGGGCICPESTMLKALMTHLVLYRDEIVLMDMEAGVEHLGRATTGSVDALLVIVNPGFRSQAAAHHIKKLGEDVGISKILVVGNRIKGPEDEKLISENLKEFDILGFIPELDEVVNADRLGTRPFDNIDDVPQSIIDICDKIIELSNS